MKLCILIGFFPWDTKPDSFQAAKVTWFSFWIMNISYSERQEPKTKYRIQFGSWQNPFKKARKKYRQIKNQSSFYEIIFIPSWFKQQRRHVYGEFWLVKKTFYKNCPNTFWNTYQNTKDSSITRISDLAKNHSRSIV